MFKRILMAFKFTPNCKEALKRAVQLAKAVGLAELSSETIILPLGTRARIQGFLLGDREGEALPDMGDLSMLARRLGGAFF